jgi:hypothetical protein
MIVWADTASGSNIRITYEGDNMSRRGGWATYRDTSYSYWERRRGLRRSSRMRLG